jgi:sodium/potassium/calcium exchanger 6
MFVIIIIAALPLCFLVHIFTYQNKPPQGFLFSNTWNFLGFLMCIAWIYTLAKELVTCLSTMGDIFHISPSFLGLTVLAWGNSIGDFFSNTAIARKGFGEMAIAGCYGGPVFNILVGLGIPFAYVCVKAYPAPLPVALDRAALLSLGFLYWTLLSTIALACFQDFQIDNFFGFYLLFVYVVYNACQLILVAM